MLAAPGTWPCIVRVTTWSISVLKGRSCDRRLETTFWVIMGTIMARYWSVYFSIEIPVHMKDNGSGPTVPDWEIVIYSSKSYYRDMIPDLTKSVIIHSERAENIQPGHHLLRQWDRAPLAKQSPLALRSGEQSQGEDVLLPTDCHSLVLQATSPKTAHIRTQALAGHREVLNCLWLAHQTITTDSGW